MYSLEWLSRKRLQNFFLIQFQTRNLFQEYPRMRSNFLSCSSGDKTTFYRIGMSALENETESKAAIQTAYTNAYVHLGFENGAATFKFSFNAH